MFNRDNMLMMTVAALLCLIPLLGGCHTTAGAGEDISKTGQAIKNSAQQNTP